MCKAFSCLVLENGDVKWKLGIDSHTSLMEYFGIRDVPTPNSPKRFAKIEITPEKGCLHIGRQVWALKIDEEIKPEWWTDEDERAARKALGEWKRQLYRILKRKPILHPLRIKPPRKITEKHLKLLGEWASVRDSVGASVWASVGASVGDSVRDSVRASVGDSVRDSVRASVGASVWDSVWASVWDSVGAYTGSLFVLPRSSWKYTDKIPSKPEYPFKSCVDLWESGLVPSFDGTAWRLHGGKEAKILWEGKL